MYSECNAKECEVTAMKARQPGVTEGDGRGSQTLGNQVRF